MTVAFYSGNFAEAHLRDGIEEAGIRFGALVVDDFRATGTSTFVPTAAICRR